MTHDPYHEHERAVQREAGEEMIADRNGTVIGSAIPPGAVPFLAQQRFVVVSWLDSSEGPWASLLLGDAGFVTSSPSGDVITVDLEKTLVSRSDEFWAHATVGARVGGLAIELMSRRRLRANGRVIDRTDQQLVIGVEEAYPNCPKYIQRRHLGNLDVSVSPESEVRVGTALTSEQAEIIRRSDTLFVASVNPSSGLDASHRGGHAGFVEVAGDGAVRIPDYAGNSMFNTLGNIRGYPRAGLLFPDFETGHILQLVGEAAIEMSAEDPDGRTGGTGRFWSVRPTSFRQWNLGIGQAWEFIDSSPFNPEVTSRDQGEGG